MVQLYGTDNQQCYGNHRKKTKIFTRNLVQHFNLLCNNGVCLCLCADAGTDEICIRLVALSYVFLGLGIHNSGSDIIIRPELKNCIAIQLTQTNHRTWFWKWVKLYKFPLLHSPVMCVCVCVYVRCSRVITRNSKCVSYVWCESIYIINIFSYTNHVI